MNYDASSRLTTSISGTSVTTYTFDANGNLTNVRPLKIMKKTTVIIVSLVAYGLLCFEIGARVVYKRAATVTGLYYWANEGRAPFPDSSEEEKIRRAKFPLGRVEIMNKYGPVQDCYVTGSSEVVPIGHVPRLIVAQVKRGGVWAEECLIYSGEDMETPSQISRSESSDEANSSTKR